MRHCVCIQIWLGKSSREIIQKWTEKRGENSTRMYSTYVCCIFFQTRPDRRLPPDRLLQSRNVAAQQHHHHDPKGLWKKVISPFGQKIATLGTIQFWRRVKEATSTAALWRNFHTTKVFERDFLQQYEWEPQKSLRRKETKSGFDVWCWTRLRTCICTVVKPYEFEVHT